MILNPNILKKIKFYIHTFGCQMNENDSERIAGILLHNGAKLASALEESNLVIVNTCAVRKKSEEKLYSLLGRLASLKQKKNLRIGVVGCVAQLYRSRLLERKPFVDFVIGPDNYNELPALLTNKASEKIIATSWKSEWPEFSPSQVFRQSKYSAYVTIMEGCNNFCAYCIVPFTRGREKFRPMSEIIREIKNLAENGYKEIHLLGQNVNSYCDPESSKSFPELLREVNQIEGLEWIRFLTSHPKNFNPFIAKAMKDLAKVCHQLHLPLQSGSSAILKKMKRGYTREEYLEKISYLRNLMPDISLSTDVIVGFPGETEEDFQQTLDLLKEVRFTNIFSFRYSPRPFTAAAKMEDNVPFKEKRRRLIELQNLQKNIQLEFNKSLRGKVIKVLCLGKSKKNSQLYSGRNEGYQVVNFKSKRNVIGRFVHVLITSCGPYSLKGKLT